MAHHKKMVKTQIWHITYVCEGKLLKRSSQLSNPASKLLLKQVQNDLIVLARMQK
jgi:hypothetical protein